MSSKIRNCVKELAKSGDPKKLIPEYVKQSMRIYNNFAEMQFMMEYYTFYEIFQEGTNPYMESEKETAETLHKMVRTYYEAEPSEVQLKEMAEELLALRQVVLDKMQVLTAYTDCFVVYEYVLNRIQYRFDDMETMPEDSVFAQGLVEYIFSGEDNTAVSDNIRVMLGQLPVRIARSRYFDWLRNSISIYIGSDKDSLDSFLYMFRMGAMMYQDEHMKEYYTEFVPVLEELAALDFEKFDRDMYQIYEEKILANASKLNDISELLLQLGHLINEMYSICASAGHAEEKKENDAVRLVIRGINALFLLNGSDVWKYSGEEHVGTEEEKLAWLGEQFEHVEGKLETIYNSVNVCGASLEEVMGSQKEMITSLGLSEDFKILENLSFLSSDSVFANLEENRQDEIVTEKFAEETADALIAECKSFFQGKSRMLRRAVMANTLGVMPIQFHSQEEVADYVVDSLQQCDDEAEKYVAKQLLLEIMQ